MLQQCREAAGENHEKRQPERLEEILGPVAFQSVEHTPTADAVGR